jgi:hypothetical protein
MYKEFIMNLKKSLETVSKLHDNKGDGQIPSPTEILFLIALWIVAEAKLRFCQDSSKFNVSLEWLLDNVATRIVDYEILFKVLSL